MLEHTVQTDPIWEIIYNKGIQYITIHFHDGSTYSVKKELDSVGGGVTQ